MKKIFTLLIGIVFLITILNAQEAPPQAINNTIPNGDTVSNKDKKRVTILYYAIELNGGKHLAMRDSNGKIAIDDLETVVKPGATIIWKRERISGIKKVTIIHSKEVEEHQVFINEPRKRLFCKGGYKLKIENDAKEGREKYYIKYIDWDDTEVPIDPHIRIDI